MKSLVQICFNYLFLLYLKGKPQSNLEIQFNKWLYKGKGKWKDLRNLRVHERQQAEQYRTKSPGRSEDETKGDREGPATSAGGGGFTFSIAWPSLYSTLWKQWWMRTYESRVAKQMTEQWGIVASKRAQELVWQTPPSRQRWGPLEILCGNLNLGTRVGRPPEGENSHSGCGRTSRSELGPGPGDWARGCPRQGMCRGGRPASSPAGGTRAGGTRGWRACLEHAGAGGQQTAGAGPELVREARVGGGDLSFP